MSEFGAVLHEMLGDADVAGAARLEGLAAGDLIATVAALQVHGAIGYTAEHDLSLWLGQVQALVPAWGTRAEHRARVLRELG